MNTTLILCILLLLAISLVLVLSYSKSKNQPQPLQPWTGDQLNRFFDIIRPILPKQLQENPDQSLLKCLVSELSRKMSFKDFVNQSNSKKLESLFGVKGQWSNCIKDGLKNDMKNNLKDISDSCVSCTISTLEQNFSPIGMSKEEFSKNLMDIISHCDSCKK